MRNIRTNPLFQASSWVIIGAGAQRFALLALGIAVVKTFGEEAFGQFALIQSTIAFAAIIASAGLSPAALKFLSDVISLDSLAISRYLYAIIATSLLLTSTITVAAYIAAPWISSLLFGTPEETRLVQVMCGILFFSASYTVLYSCLQGLGHYRSYGSLSTVGAIALLTVAGIATSLQTSSSIYLAWLVVVALQAMLAYVVLAKRLVGRYDAFLFLFHSKELFTRLIRFAASAAAYSGLWMAGLWLCNVLVAHGNNGLQEVALFAAAYQWFSIMIFVPGVLGAIIIPALARSVAEGNVFRTRHLLLRLSKRYALTGASMWAVLSIMSPFVLAFYGERFASDGLFPFLLVTGSGAFAVAAAPLVHALLALGSAQRLLGFAVFWLLLLLFFIFSVFGTSATGVAASLFLSYAAYWSACIYHITSRKWLKATSVQ